MGGHSRNQNFGGGGGSSNRGNVKISRRERKRIDWQQGTRRGARFNRGAHSRGRGQNARGQVVPFGGSATTTNDSNVGQDLRRVDNMGQNCSDNQGSGNVHNNFKNPEEDRQNQLQYNNYDYPANHSERDKSFSKFRDLQYRQQQQQKNQQHFSPSNRGQQRLSISQLKNLDEPSHINEKNHAPEVELFAKENNFGTANNLTSEKNLTATPSTPNEITEKQEVVVKIKVEKTEHNQSKPTAVVKPPDSSSSSSSDSSSDEEDQNKKKVNADLPKSVQTIQIINSKSSSSSSSGEDTSSDEETVQKPKVSVAKKVESSDESTSSDDENTTKKTMPVKSESTPKTPTKTDTGNDKKKILVQTTQTESTEDEVVCLGKVENTFVLEDEEETTPQALLSDENDKKKAVEICLLCDKQVINKIWILN